MFPNATHVEIGGHAIVYQIQGDAVIFKFGDGSYTEQERAMIRDHVSNTIAFKLPDINAIMRTHSLTQSIRTLPRAEAVFNDYQNKKKTGPCFKGTREALLREMADWTTSPSKTRMYVLSGLAGIGKSTVAYTIATRTADLGLLGASFFFSRDEADRNNAKKFFTTIAYQLCVYDEAFANAIGEVLLTECGSAAITKDPQEQLQALIVEPLRSIVQTRTRSILVVVDGLDECNEDDEHGVIMGLSQLVQLLPSFKVILTTRPRPLVDYFFCDQDGQCHKIFHLQNIEDKVVDGDIRSYLSHSLSLKQVRVCLRNPKEQWCANDKEIDYLVRAAGRLFIIASTAVLYVLNRTLGDPGSRMKKLLSEIAHDRTPFHALNHFYSIILRSAIPINGDDDDIQDRYQNVIGTITFIQILLPVATLTCFMGEESEKVYAILRNLQSVILLGSDDVPRIYHKSFSDYVTDPVRCKDSYLLINPRTRHTLIAIRCFEIMDKHLKYNILGFSVPAQFMSNEDGLGEDGITDEKLQEKIPQELRYACVHWTNHVAFANIESRHFMNGLAKFVDEHTLHWIEILSLIGKLDLAHLAICAVLKLLSPSSDLHRILSDALRLISKFYELIKGSALHTYHSALPFAPTESLLYRQYMKKPGYNGFCIAGGPEKWDSLIASRNHGESVDIVKFSLNGTLLLSSSDHSFQGNLKIWDATTGTPISTITGRNFATANDFSTIVSSEIDTIMFYNMNGSPQNAMLTTQSKVEELAFSSAVGRLAARLSDGSIWLWDSRNSKLINNFNEFEESAQLQFSPAGTVGTRLIYWTMPYGIIKLRDGISGRLITDMAVESWANHRIIISNDGSRIASLSSNYSLALWDSGSGRLIDAVRVSLDTYDNRFAAGLAISANGSILAVMDRTEVKLWSTGNMLSLFAVLNESSRSLAFSLDNILAIITNSGTIKLYHIEMQSFISTPSILNVATSLAFSSDCTRLAVGSDEGTVYIWDIQNIAATDSSREQSTRHSITALALSRNSSRLAYGIEDGTVELWETNPTERRIATYQAHDMEVGMLEFVPDGGLFASVSSDRTVKLWYGEDGSLRGSFESPTSSLMVALSNSMIAVAWDCGVALRALDTLTYIHTFKEQDRIQFVSISDDSDLVAVVFDFNCIRLFDTMNRTTIAIFDVPRWIQTLTFLPDNSQLVILCDQGDFHSLNLFSKKIVNRPIFEHLIQLPNVPLWCGHPIWYRGYYKEQYLALLFSQDKSAVPVLFIPNDYDVTESYMGSSMIALHCRDGRVLRVRLPLP